MMRKLIALLFISSSLLFGGLDIGFDTYVKELKGYLLSKEFQVTGTFFLKDNRWIFGLKDPYGQIVELYELLGSPPSPQNPLGWKVVDEGVLEGAVEMGWFIKIDFPLDLQDPSTAPYSWVYIDKGTQSVYKLMDAHEGRFYYLDIDHDSIPDPLPIYYNLNPLYVIFFECKSVIESGDISFTILSKSQGEISYRCDGKWNAPNDLLIQNITITKALRGKVDEKSFIGSIFKDFRLGKVDVEGMVEGEYIECTQAYTPPKFDRISNAKALEEAILTWGTSQDPKKGFIAHNCDLPKYQANSFNLTIDSTISIYEKDSTSTITIHKEAIKR